MVLLWRNRVFRIVFTADLIQQLAIWVRNMALLFYVMEQTNDDPVAVSLLTLFEYAPIFLFSFIGGALADRWNPKKTVIAGDWLSALSMLGILGFVAYGSWQAVFAAAAVSAVVTQFSQPSSAILFKRHIPEEQVGAAIGLSQGAMSLFLIFGPIVGTLCYSWLGLEASLATLAALLFLSGLVQCALPPFVRDAERRDVSLLADMADGLRFVRGKRSLLVLAASFALLGLASGLVAPLDVFLVTDRLGLPKESLQWLYAASGVGLLVGAAIAATSASKLNVRAVTFVGFALLAGSMIAEALSPWLGLTAAMRFMVGFALAFVQVVLGSLLVKWVDEAYVGRVNGILTPLFMAGTVTGTAAAGPMMKAFTLLPVFFLAAAVSLAAAFVSLGMRPERAENG